MTISIDDSAGSAQAIGNDILTAMITMPSGVQDITGINSSGMERLLLLADLQLALTGVFNDAANMSHAVLKNHRTLPGSEVGRTTTIAHSGQTLADPLLYANYDLSRAQDGSLIWSSTGLGTDGGVPAWA